MLTKIMATGLVGLIWLSGLAVAQTPANIRLLRDEVSRELMAKNHWSAGLGTKPVLTVHESFKPTGAANPAGAVVHLATVLLQFSGLPGKVTATELWELQVLKDKKGQFSLIVDSLRQVGAINLRGLTLPSRHGTLQAVYKILRNRDLVRTAIPNADKIIQIRYVDAFKDPAKPAVGPRLESRRDSKVSKIWYNVGLTVLLDQEWFQSAGDGRGWWRSRGPVWYVVRFERPAGGDWTVVPGLWQMLPVDNKPTILDNGQRYRPEVVGLFPTLADDGLDAIFGELASYTGALTRMVDWKIPGTNELESLQ